MKKTLTILATIVALFLGSAVANAQPGMGGPGGMSFDPSQMAKMMADQMKDQLKLTDAQYTKVLDMYKKENEEMSKKMQAGGGPGAGMDFEAMMKDLQEMQARQEAKLKEILTADQLKKYKEMMANFGGGMGGPGGPGMGGPGGPGGPGPR